MNRYPATSLVARAVAKIKAEANAVQRREDSAAEKDAIRQIFSKDDSDLQPISISESRDLIALEKIVAKGLQTFVEVGEALAEIRDRKLYKIEHATFADYCKEKWKMSDRRARQLMDSAEVVGDLAKSGTVVPLSERQARPLTQLPQVQRAEAFREAAKTSATGTPTAKEVEAVVKKLKPKKAQQTPTEETPAKTTTEERIGYLQVTYVIHSGDNKLRGGVCEVKRLGAAVYGFANPVSLSVQSMEAVFINRNGQPVTISDEEEEA
jgi:hypothetical protein